ncbi:MAG: hypothetical protein CMN28_16235 [Salinisphaeraceae bacterium]|nr:hypothetical protein [Salinisphaeraceae bacterium]
MSDNIYKVVEVVGSSSESSDDAVAKAIAEASKRLRKLRWFKVTETRGHLEDGKIAHWQVSVKVGFHMDGDE